MSNIWRSNIFLGQAKEKLNGKSILVAGCGADGSHAVLALASVMGQATSTRLVLADPDTYDDPNLGIQVVDKNQIGKNKAIATGDMIQREFPGIKVDVYSSGVTTGNIPSLLNGIDVVVDAVDISGTGISGELHKQASKLGVPVVVPWSLGMGAATIVFTKPGEYALWGHECEAIANKLGMKQYAGIARWLVDHPDGLTLDYLDEVLAGLAPTPTTFFGAAEGGRMTARWIMGYFLGHRMPTYPDAIVTSTDFVRSNTRIINFADATHEALLSLKEDEN
jgi:ThiF family